MLNKNSKSINKTYWENLSEDDLNKFKQEVFDYYRSIGFPFFPTDPAFRKKEYQKLKNYDHTKVIKGVVIRQTMHGLSLAWSYMPHSWSVVCNGMMTPVDVFHDDVLFKRVIEKRLRFGDNMSDNGIRKTLKMFTGAQSVSNFKPTAAAAIYSMFVNPGDVVWDMSSGYGGRLLGSSLLNMHYLGTDPCRDTHLGLVQMADELNIPSTLHRVGSEVFVPDRNSLDFCFTSPPYFNTEQYDDSETQSYMRYKTKQEWSEGFLRKTMRNCYHGLKPNKYMAINIANVKTFRNLENECVDAAIESGFIHVETLQYSLSNMKAGFKYEPIFIFKKSQKRTKP